MKEAEFLLYLNNLVISENYDDDYLKHLFLSISKFFKPQAMESNIFRRKDDSQKLSNQNIKITKTISIKVPCINAELIIKNPQRELEHPEITIPMLETILNNIFKNRLIIERLSIEKNLDELTKVQNRTAYEDKIKETQNYSDLSVAFIDVNGLGVENNRYGHEAGDKMLKTVANTIADVFRLKDIYRIGGDEFVVICPNITEELFNKKITILKELIELTDYRVSIGVSHKTDTNDIKQAIEEANIEMKYAKEKFRKENPEMYENKYEVTFIGKKDTSKNFH